MQCVLCRQPGLSQGICKGDARGLTLDLQCAGRALCLLFSSSWLAAVSHQELWKLHSPPTVVEVTASVPHICQQADAVISQVVGSHHCHRPDNKQGSERRRCTGCSDGPRRWTETLMYRTVEATAMAQSPVWMQELWSSLA